jgi:hypothetical protein
MRRQNNKKRTCFSQEGDIKEKIELELMIPCHTFRQADAKIDLHLILEGSSLCSLPS